MSHRPDIAWSKQVSRASVGQIFLWSCAAALALAAHAGAVWWIMREPPASPMEQGAPVAIMIDLAPVAMAPPAEEEQIAPDTVESVAAEAAPTPDEAEPVEPAETAELVEPVTPEAEEVSEPPSMEPVEAEEPLEPVETIEEAEVVPEVVDVPIPTPRPNRPPPPPKVAEKPREPERTRPRPQKSAPSREATRAQVQAQQNAPQVAAPQSNRGAASVSPARWQSRLLAHLERRKRYPANARRQRLEGVAQVRFTIDANGNVQSVALAGSSGVAELDQEVMAMVRRASPVPAPPPGVDRTIVVPVRFNLR